MSYVLKTLLKINHLTGLEKTLLYVVYPSREAIPLAIAITKGWPYKRGTTVFRLVLLGQVMVSSVSPGGGGTWSHLGYPLSTSRERRWAVDFYQRLKLGAVRSA